MLDFLFGPKVDCNVSARHHVWPRDFSRLDVLAQRSLGYAKLFGGLTSRKIIHSLSLITITRENVKRKMGSRVY